MDIGPCCGSTYPMIVISITVFILYAKKKNWDVPIIRRFIHGKRTS